MRTAKRDKSAHPLPLPSAAITEHSYKQRSIERVQQKNEDGRGQWARC